MAEKNYIKGSAKAVATQYGEIINLSLNIDELNAVAKKWYVAVSVMQRRETDQYGNTHYVIENTYNKPEIKKEEIEEDDNLPF